MTSFTERVLERLSEAIQDRDVQGMTNGFTIKETEDEGWVLQTSLVAEEPPSLFDEADEGEGSLDKWDGVYEQLELPLTGRLQKDCLKYIEAAQSATETSENATITNALIESYDDVSSVRLDWEIDLIKSGFTFSDLADRVVTAEEAPIDEAELVGKVEVRQPLAQSSEDSMMFPDYKIQYETQEPHKLWNELDSIEDYAERVAKNNEEYSVEDVLSRDTYTSYYHLTGEVHPNTWLQSSLPPILDSELTTQLDGGTKYTSDLVAQRDGEVKVTGSIVCSIQQV